MVAPDCNPGRREAEGGGLLPGSRQPDLHREPQDSLGYQIRPRLKEPNGK